MLRIILEKESWRYYEAEMVRQKVRFDNFEDFVTARPPVGLGTTMEDLMDMCRHDPELQQRILEATVS
jgi:hypothetical protein